MSGIDAQAIVDEILNKQLEPHGLTVKSPEIKNDPEWYRTYTCTPEQMKEWMEWGVNFVQKKLKTSRKKAEEEMAWINLQWGLREVQDEVVR